MLKSKNNIIALLAITYLFLLVSYSFGPLYLHIFHLLLLINAYILCKLAAEKISSYSDTFGVKIFYSLLLDFFIFSLIIFFWFLGNNPTFRDEKMIGTFFIIIPSVAIVGLIAFLKNIRRLKNPVASDNTNAKLKKPIIITTLLIIVILFLFYYNDNVLKFTESGTDPEICNSFITFPSSYLFSAYHKADCLYNVATNKQDLDLCDKICLIKNIPLYDFCENNYKLRCFQNIANQKQDINICLDKFKNDGNLNYCILSIAEDAKNKELCEYLPGGNNSQEEIKEDSLDKNYCIANVAEAANDKNICVEILNKEDQDYCLSRFNK